MQVWLNGRFVARDDAVLSVFDAGFQHAVGLFETMLARRGRVFRPEAHLHRLATSATELQLTTRLRTGPLGEALELTLDRNELESARVRLTVTGGNLNMLASSGQGPQDPTVLIVAQPPTEYPDSFFTSGVTVVVADGRLNPLDPMAGHKTLNYWVRLRALQGAATAGAGEALWFSVSNHLASGSVSNVFIVKDGALVTPIAHGEEVDGALPAPVLAGITRDAVIEIAGTLGLATDRRMLDFDELTNADEVFLTNSSWGVLPVIAVERTEIGNGKVGPLTQSLREAWLRVVDDETGL